MYITNKFTRTRRIWIAVALTSLFLLPACQNGQGPAFLQAKDNSGASGTPAQSRSVKLVERDVEAPDVFQITENGLWDGRPSLGGVWVAHPNVKDPERVIIRNEKNGKFVIGALFRRELENPGPRLQVSSDAAATLGLLAGQPAKLNVTALRREEVAENGPAPDAAPQTTAPQSSAPGTISETALAPAATGVAASGTQAASAPKPAPAPSSGGLSKPFIQLGIFSVEQNAKNTGEAMRVAGMVPTIKKSSSSGKPFWRVLVGPAQTSAERAALLKKIKASGFADAYAVSN
ncbi:SPOR domain-containing protein [Planktotalea arctica]|uniref:SPOR domain-containing protein n=1 Tax=Planktotalea arctica TaxID=1481893 RepID=UPI0032190A2C